MPFVIDIKDINQDSSAICGAKASNLARLIQSGFPVPNGFCVSINAWSEILESNNLRSKIKSFLNSVDSSPIEQKRKILEVIRQAIKAAPVPKLIRDEIDKHFFTMKADYVAVRSSASCEDNPSQSFAGQHDTFLGISGLENCIDAIRKCWASLWSERAFEYRERNRINYPDVDMAVIVQRMVPATVSGVIFTVDPVTGNRERLVIESIFGLGEPLVAGLVVPDRIIISKPDFKIIECTVSEKSIERTLDQSKGIIEKSVSEDRKRIASLNEQDATQLSKLALRIEKEFGCPQDIEFAISSNEISILQTRPITTLSDKIDSWDDHQVWTNANTGEVAPDVMPPMTWSIVKPLAIQLLAFIFGRLGIDLSDVTIIGVVAGRAYFNYNTMIACARNVPGLGEKSITEMFGGRQDIAKQLGEIKIDEKDIPKLKFSRIRLLWILPGLLYRSRRYKPSMAQAVLDRLRHEIDDEVRIHPEKLTIEELGHELILLYRRLHEDDEMMMTIATVSFYQMVLYQICKKWFGDEGQGLASQMLMAGGNNEVAKAGLDLWRLAELANETPSIRDIIMDSKEFSSLREKLISMDGGSRFIKAWDSFMEEHGHHCRGELELINPRWSEMPDYILEQLKSYLAGIDKNNFIARYINNAKERERVVNEVKSKLKSSSQRSRFSAIYQKSLSCSPYRESIKSQIVRRLAVIRRILLELDRRLIDKGMLKNSRDIFFLRIDELENLISELEDLQIVAGQIANRRAEYEFNRTVEPPPVVIGRFIPDLTKLEQVETGLTMLQGIALNPGIVTGPARVINRAGEDQVLPGEILVAPFTDPGWTPYFINAAALVVDAGGILSHGSIVAREYGIPAVANVGPATKIIKTGQMIQVDGNRGVVRIL